MSEDDPFVTVDGAARAAAASERKAVARVLVLPVPKGTPRPPAVHPTLGKPSTIWTYRGASGGILGYALRFDTQDGKQFRPLTCWRPTPGGALEWRWEAWPSKRPLYGLQRLAERPSALVVVTEGEKAADAATGLLPGFVVVTSPNGSKAASKADWSPLRGRDVTIWPDADTAGLQYAQAVAKQAIAARAASVAIVSPPKGVLIAWDAADALAEGWTPARAAKFVAAAAPFNESAPASNTPGGSSSAGKRRRTPQRDVLIGCAEFVKLWHDGNTAAYASFLVNGHDEHWLIRSRDFRMWLAGRFYEETGGAIGAQALEDGLRILEARAVHEGPLHDPCLRVGRHGDALYLDLCDDRWRAIEIRASGWTIIDRPPVKFLRTPAMRALPQPEKGYLIEELRRFVNVRSDDDFKMAVAWITAALRDVGPYPILIVNGEQGTGKSFFCRMIRSLIDPNIAPIRALPKDERDLIVSACNTRVLAFDNLSKIDAWLSDAFCRLSNGGGFATRMLHTDRDEMIFDGQRPVMLNGIAMLTERPDLAERALTIHLCAITDEERKPEDELWAEFEAQRPRILGAILDAISAALRNLPSVKLLRAPRMADFLKWVTAAEGALGWHAGEFETTYRENRRDVAESAFEADPVAMAIRDFVTPTDYPNGWAGTATELLAALNDRGAESIRKSRLWPWTSQGLGMRIDRIAPLLRSRGFQVERRHSGVRTITIVPPQHDRSARQSADLAVE
jgi:putative DNA primase/helicase